MNVSLAAMLALALAVYVRLTVRYNARHTHPLSRWYLAAFAGAITTLWLALQPPLEPLVDASFLYHMTQHMLLIYVAAPLLLLSAPVMLVLGALTPEPARRAGRLLRSPVMRFMTFPVFTWLFFTAVMWGTHLSGLYQAALEHSVIHFFEHGLFLFAALLFWQAIIHIGPVSWPMNFSLRIVYVFLAMPQSAFLGLALFQSGYVLYPHYVATQGSVAQALADQRNGGALMWIAGGLLLFIIFMIAAAMWGYHERRLGERLDAQLDRDLLPSFGSVARES